MAIESSDIGDELNPTLDVAEEEEEVEEGKENAPEEEEVEGDGVGEGEEKEEEYTFRFENGMSPLEFVDNNDSGVQRYQQFERLENQALADKKRKTLSQSHTEGTSSKKAREDDDISLATMAEIMEVMNHGVRRISRKLKKRDRRKGSKNKLNPQLTRMLCDATLHYACGRNDQAISVLHEVVRLAPNLPDSYHILGLVYISLEDYKRAMDFYMIAAHLTPKDSSLWKMLFTWSIEQGDIGQASYCLSKAITADPKDITLRTNPAQKQVAEENKRKAIVVTTEKAELAASEGKPFCISRVDVGLDVAAVCEAVTKVLEQKGLSVMVFSTDESTNMAVVCAGVLEKGDKGKLDVSEWLSNSLGPLKGKCGEVKGGLATGQGTDASHVNEAMEFAASFASMKLS